MSDMLANVQIVILAAGKGKRMESEKPKALAELRGKPFLRHILDTLGTLPFALPPVIVVGHQKEDIMQALGPGHAYAHQAEQLGTGHAVLSAREAMHPAHETVVVLLADAPLISSKTILSVLARHAEKRPAITMGTIVVPDFLEWRSVMEHFGRIVRSSDGKVMKNIEWKDASPAEREIKEVNPSIYAFDREWLWENISKLKNQNAQGEYYLTDLVGLAVSQGRDVEAVPVYDIAEGLQPNSRQELEILESLVD